MASMARGSADSTVLRVAQREIPLVVSRNNRARRITLRLDGLSGDVRLVLPKRMALREGLDFATQKADWLLAQLDALPARIPFTDGAVIPLLGRDHVIRHVAGARRGVWRQDGEIFVSGFAEHLPRRVTDFLKSEARAAIGPLAQAKAARIERRVTRLTIRHMTSRWGSCGSDGALCFCWRLVLAPEPVFDYVVAHEVAHLRYMSHGPRFWKLVSRLTPDMDGARRWLKGSGDTLLAYG
jgi:predicted metal-dependent hydrolase